MSGQRLAVLKTQGCALGTRRELGAGQHPPSHGKGGRAASVVQATGRRTCCERSWTDSRSPRTGHASSLPAGNAFLSGLGS